MKIISRKNTIQIEDELHTRILLKDDPEIWEVLRESMVEYFKRMPVKPNIKAYHDELINADVIEAEERPIPISECYSGSMEEEDQAFFDELNDGLPKNEEAVKAKMIEAWEIEKNYLVNSSQQEHILSFEDWSESLTDADIEEILKGEERMVEDGWINRRSNR
jgi:hypothetical protein